MSSSNLPRVPRNIDLDVVKKYLNKKYSHHDPDARGGGFLRVTKWIGQSAEEDEILEIYSVLAPTANTEPTSNFVEWIRELVRELIQLKNISGNGTPAVVGVSVPSSGKILKFVTNAYPVTKHPRALKKGASVRGMNFDVVHGAEQKKLTAVMVQNTGACFVVTEGVLNTGESKLVKGASVVSLATIEATVQVWEQIFAKICKDCNVTAFALNPAFYDKCVTEGWIK